MAPTFGPVQSDPLFEELSPFIIETEEDLLVFRDPLSPQSLALTWLQDDPITMNPGRSIEKVLERYALAVFYYSTSGPSWTVGSFMLTDEDVCEWNDQRNRSTPFGIYCWYQTGRIDFIELGDNNLEGTLPWKELSLLPELFFLQVNYNGLYGPVLGLSRLRALTDFRAIANYFTGSLPEDVPPSFRDCDMNENLTTGSIPASWVSKTTPFEYLYFWKSSLTGTIPSGLAVPGLVGLDLAENMMTGPIPTELGQVSTFDVFFFDGNSFTGNVEEIFCHRTDWVRLVADCKVTSCSCCTPPCW